MSRGNVDAGADAQDEALALGEIEIALECADRIRDVNLEVAELEIAEAERARVEIGIELGDDAYFADRRGGSRRILELDGVGLSRALRDELLRAVG